MHLRLVGRSFFPSGWAAGAAHTLRTPEPTPPPLLRVRSVTAPLTLARSHPQCSGAPTDFTLLVDQTVDQTAASRHRRRDAMSCRGTQHLRGITCVKYGEAAV